MRKLFRRDFLKYSAAGASILAVEHYFGSMLASASVKEAPYVNRNTGRRVKGIATTCAGCGAGCGIMAYVSDGVLMKLCGNPAHPVNKGRLCLVGEAGIYALADPERLIAPMKRIGKRGQGHWKQISWKEASELVAEKLKEGKGRLVVESRGGHTDEVSRSFIGIMGGGKLVSHGHVVSANREAAMMATFGAPYDLPDIANTGYILNFGANPLVSDTFGVATMSAITASRASDNTVKLVTIDPRLSETAGNSDEWISIMPGTDGMVALAMANVIIREGLFDPAFIQRRTNTSVAALKSHLSGFTPEAAERISGIKAEDIRRIALEYARSDRAVVLTGGGVSSYGHGIENERAIRLLPVITGKVDRPGCNYLPRNAEPTSSDMSPEEFYASLVSDSTNTGVYIIHGCDPAYTSPSPDRLSDVLADEGKVGFIVSIDTHITDTGEYADLILPMTTYLEEYALESAPSPDGGMLIRYRRPVVRPVGASKPYLDMLSDISVAAGKNIGYRSSGGYVAKKILETPAISGTKQIARLEQNGFFTEVKHGSGRHSRTVEAFKTGSGKVELNWKGGAGLPSMTSPETFSNWKKGELVLVKYKPAGYMEGFSENNLLLKELNHTNKAIINAGLGRALGLKNRDKVVLSSPAGRIKAQVMLSPGINENTVAIAEGCGHKAYGNIEKGKRFRSADPFTHVIWWGESGSGVNPNRAIPLQASSTSGVKGWSLTKVSLLKA